MKYTLDELKKGVIVDTKEAKRLRDYYRTSWHFELLPSTYVDEHGVSDKWNFRITTPREVYGWN